MNTPVPFNPPPGRPLAPLGPTGPETLGVDVDLRQMWSTVYRNRMLIAGVILLALVAGLIATMLMTRVYRADASVQIEQQASKVLSTEDTEPLLSAQEGDRFLQTQIDILKSRALAIRVMQSLDLLKDDGFLDHMRVKPVTEPVGDLSLAASRREQIIQILLKKMSVTLPRNSRIAQVSFFSPDPDLAARVANSFVNNFITSNLQRHFDASAYARGFLEQRLAEAKQRLEESERAMIDYARKARLIDASAGTAGTGDSPESGPRSLTTSDLVQLNQSLAGARAGRVDRQQRYIQALHTPLMSLPEVLANPAVQQLTQQRVVAQSAYIQEGQRHKSDFPTMRQAAAQIASLDKQIRMLALSIRDGLHDQYLTSLKQEQALSSNVESLKGDTLAEQDRSVRYNILRRETDTNRSMYDGLLQRFKQVSAESGVTTNNISVVDVADVPPKPVSPRSLINLALAGILGLAVAAVLVFGREKLDDVVRSPDDIQNKLGLPFLSSVPLLTGGMTQDKAITDPRSAMSESYAALRTSLELSSQTGLPGSLLVTSSRQAEGKSTTSYALARDCARLGMRVLLIDGDLRKPSLHRQLGLSNKNGLVSILARHRTFDQAVQATNVPNLHFLACGPLPPNPAELLSGPVLSEQMRVLRERYELIVVDGPPVLGLADAILLASNVDGTLFVVEANGSHHGHVKAALRRLTSSGVTLLGAVLTKFDARKIGYGDYQGYYSYSYGRDVANEG